MPDGRRPRRRQLGRGDGAARAQPPLGHGLRGRGARASWAPELGADVPFFIVRQQRLGRGHRRAPRPGRPRRRAGTWSWCPRSRSPTREIFAAPELTRNTEPLKMEDFSAQSDFGVATVSQRSRARRGRPISRGRSASRVASQACAGCAHDGFRGVRFRGVRDPRGGRSAVLRRDAAGTMKGFVAQGLDRSIRLRRVATTGL